MKNGHQQTFFGEEVKELRVYEVNYVPRQS